MKFGKGYWKTFQAGLEREFVMTNHRGGYGGLSIIGSNARAHHGILVASLKAPINRKMILQNIFEKITIHHKEYDLKTIDYGLRSENGYMHQQRFEYHLYPNFTYQVEDVLIDKSIFMINNKNQVIIKYTIENGHQNVKLSCLPMFNYRDHGEVSKKEDLRFEYKAVKNGYLLSPQKASQHEIYYQVSQGDFDMRKEEAMYEQDITFHIDMKNGNPSKDNALTPFEHHITLQPFEKKTVWISCELMKKDQQIFEDIDYDFLEETYISYRKELVEKAGFENEWINQLVLASDQFIAFRESTGYNTVLAGLPWFTDWGRDTMIALQGLTLSTKRYDETRSILKTFALYVKDGLVPNMFPDEGGEALYNTVDASLWYFYSVYMYLKHTGAKSDYDFVYANIYPKLKEIINAYKRGTKFSIFMDTDYLIHAGDGLDQVTWMDVRVGELVVTPRHGKPVEINALWYNALMVMTHLANYYDEESSQYSDLALKVKASFTKKFWNESKQCLYDVVDENDEKVRPNQIWAVSLPFTMLSKEQNKAIVYKVYSQLYATYGLRSLSEDDSDYHGIYTGPLMERDLAYHQGTTWGFPLGGFISAYVKIHDYSKESAQHAYKLIAPIEDHLRDGCIGSIAEIFDGDEPIISRGCYAQAWSVGEILRAYSDDIKPYI